MCVYLFMHVLCIYIYIYLFIYIYIYGNGQIHTQYIAYIHRLTLSLSLTFVFKPTLTCETSQIGK